MSDEVKTQTPSAPQTLIADSSHLISGAEAYAKASHQQLPVKNIGTGGSLFATAMDIWLTGDAGAALSNFTGAEIGAAIVTGLLALPVIEALALPAAVTAFVVFGWGLAGGLAGQWLWNKTGGKIDWHEVGQLLAQAATETILSESASLKTLSAPGLAGLLTTYIGRMVSDAQTLAAGDPSSKGLTRTSSVLQHNQGHIDASINADVPAFLNSYQGDTTTSKIHIVNTGGIKTISVDSLTSGPTSNTLQVQDADGQMQTLIAFGSAHTAEQLSIAPQPNGTVSITTAIDNLVEVVSDQNIGRAALSFVFQNASGTLRIDDPRHFVGSIANMLVGDTIDLRGIGTANDVVQGSGNTVTVVSKDGTAVDLSIGLGDGTAGYYMAGQSDGHNGTELFLSHDAPAVTSAPASEILVGGLTLHLPGISVSDPAATTETFTLMLSDGSGLLSTSPQSGGSVSGAGSHRLTLTGTLAAINAELASLTYKGNPAASADTIHVTMLESTGGGDVHDIAVTVLPPVPAGGYGGLGGGNIRWAVERNGNWDNGYWSTGHFAGTTWVPGPAPGPLDSAIVDVAATVTVSSAVTVGGITMAAGDLELTAGGTISDATLLATGGTFGWHGGTLDHVTYRGTLEVGAPTFSPSSLGVYIENGLTVTGPDGSGPGLIDIDIGGTLTFVGNQTLDNVTINMSGPDELFEGSVLASAPGSQLTLGTNVVLSHIGGSLGGLSGAIVNNGTIVAGAANEQFYIECSTFTNRGTIDVIDDDSLFLGVGGAWSNSGTIEVSSGGTLDLMGDFTTAGMGSISNDGGAISIGFNEDVWVDTPYLSTLDNSGATLFIGPGSALGNIELRSGGTIVGGTIEDAGAGLVARGGVLDGVTYDGTMRLGDLATLNVTDGLLLRTADGTSPGTVIVDGNYASLQFENSTTFDNAIVKLGDGTIAVGAFPQTSDGIVLTLGPNITVTCTQGSGADIGDAAFVANPGDTIINKGTINVLALNASLKVGLPNFTNQGTINSGSDNSVLIVGEYFTNDGTIDGLHGSSHFSFLLADADNFTNNGTIKGGFTADSVQSFTNNGLIVIGSIGGAEIAAPIDGTGTIDIENANVALLAACAATQAIQLGTDAGVTLQTPDTFAGTIAGFGTGDAIVLPTLTSPSGTILNYANGVLTITPGGPQSPVSIHFEGSYATGDFAIQSYGSGQTEIVYAGAETSVIASVQKTYAAGMLASESKYSASGGLVQSVVFAHGATAYGHAGLLKAAHTSFAGTPWSERDIYTNAIGLVQAIASRHADGTLHVEARGGGSTFGPDPGGEAETVVLRAGSRDDVFDFSGQGGPVTIKGYLPGSDSLDFDHSLFSDFSDMMAHTSQHGSEVLITHDGSVVVAIWGVSLGVLSAHAGDFHFV